MATLSATYPVTILGSHGAYGDLQA
jgi:hypothetical protein